ncbi:MAG: hypothetical protein WCJ16_06450 [Actinomycetes bacterium]
MTQGVRFTILRDKRTHYAYLFLVLAWACFRAIAINKFFGQHNVNAWGYLVVDLGASVPYALYSTRAVVNFLDKDWIAFRRNVILTTAFFYIPDIYVFIFARTVPRSLYLGFAISIIIFSTMALLSLKRDISKPK